MKLDNPLWSCFNALEDPRQEKQSSRHPLIDILMLTIIAVICGADNWVAIERFGELKQEWLKTFLELPNGIPSHDTIGNFFARVNPESLRIEQGGDYVFNLKGNQSTLHKDVKEFMEGYVDGNKLKKVVFDQHEIIDGDHGRIERRRYWMTEEITWLPQAKDWGGLKSIGRVEYESIEKTIGRKEIERRCFITSLAAKAKPFSAAVRMHWGIENGLHGCLEVGFGEDTCHVRKEYGPENFAVIRHMALN